MTLLVAPPLETRRRGEALDPLRWGETLSGPPISSGRLSSSAPILVRRWRGVTPDIDQPALDHHYLTLHLGGPKRIRRTGSGPQVCSDLAEGAYSVTPAGSAFHWRTEGPVDFAHVYLPPAAIDQVVAAEFDRDPQVVSLRDPLGARDPLLEAMLKILADALDAEERPGRLYWDGFFHTLLCRLLHLHSTVSEAARPALHGLAPSRVRRVLDYIEANLDQHIGLSELASTAGVSPFHFTRGFHRATGHAPYAFLVLRRLERAKVLLTDTDAPLFEVARACGFNSHGQFSTMFKRAAGVSPSRYRGRG